VNFAQVLLALVSASMWAMLPLVETMPAKGIVSVLVNMKLLVKHRQGSVVSSTLHKQEMLLVEV
jgi:hypothetical protein